MSFSTSSSIATFCCVVVAVGLLVTGSMLVPASRGSRTAYSAGVAFAVAVVVLVAARFMVLA